MLKTIFRTLIVLALALGGGIGFTHYTLEHFGGFGELRIGNWSAFPDSGTASADPYAKARAARQSSLAPGPAEALIFYARADSTGRDLQRECNYRLSGFTPPARFWSLYPADPKLHPVKPREGLLRALHSHQIAYDNNGSMTVIIGPETSPGNWLPVDGRGQYVLIMTLYDSPAASSAGLVDLVMPQLEMLPDQGGSCHG